MYLDYKCKWNFLFNSEKHLKTASFVAVFGLVGTMGTLYNYTLQKVTQERINDKKLVAELIAKSRIEWLKEMRELVSQYMSLANQASFYLEQNWAVLKSKHPKKSKLVKYNKLVQNAEVYYYKILFNLNNKEEITAHLEKYHYIFNIDTLKQVTTNKPEEIMKLKAIKEYLSGKLSLDSSSKCIQDELRCINEKINLQELKNPISNYRKDRQVEVGIAVQAYFKKEWDKAKEEIRSGEVAPPDKQEK